MDGGLVVLAAERARARIDVLQRYGEFVELAGVGRAEQRLVDDRDFLYAADRAFELESFALGELALPAALGLLVQRIEPLGDKRRCRLRLLGIAKDTGIQHAEDGGLFHHR